MLIMLLIMGNDEDLRLWVDVTCSSIKDELQSIPVYVNHLCVFKNCRFSLIDDTPIEVIFLLLVEFMNSWISNELIKINDYFCGSENKDG